MEFVDSKEETPQEEVTTTSSTDRDDGGIAVGQYCVVIPPEDAEQKAPVDRIIIPADVAEIHDDDEQVYIIGTRDGKVTQIVGLERVKKLKVSEYDDFLCVDNL